VCDVDTDAAAAARLKDARPRLAARDAPPQVDGLATLTTGAQVAAVPTPGGDVAPLLGRVAEVYGALVLGTRDYVEKNGFEHVVLGLSGGIDSTLVALVAVDALGPERVTCVVMPSRFSSEGTQSDARTLAANLGVDVRELPIAG